MQDADNKKEAKGKAKSNEQTNKADKKLINLDPKEVYEVFRHGAHYLREANKPEVQRTELNRIELSMPKKLVDTVRMPSNTHTSCMHACIQYIMPKKLVDTVKTLANATPKSLLGRLWSLITRST